MVRQFAQGEILVVAATSASEDTIADHTGHWFMVYEDSDSVSLLDPAGWVFSKFVDYVSTLSPPEMSVDPEQRNLGTSLLEYRRAELTVGEATARILMYKQRHQNFYSFSWNEDSEEFHYSHVPGTFLWHPYTGEVEHVTYEGHTIESGFKLFTDDMRYMLQDGGTSPGVRGLTIHDLENPEAQRRGFGYLGDPGLRGHTIEIAYEVSSWNIDRGRIDEETMSHAERCVTEDTFQERYDEYETNVVVIYRYDLDSDTREFLRCTQLPVQ